MNNYCVYAYVFDDGMTYVGLTRQMPRERHREHQGRRKRSSTVLKYADSVNVPFPNMYVLYTGLTKTKAQRTEDLLVKAIDPEFRLNRMPTGVGIGSTGQPEGLAMTPEERASRQIERRVARREQIAEYRAAYYKANREHILAYHADYRKADAERIAEYDAVYRKANAERITERRRADVERRRAYDADYRARHKAQRAKYWAEYRKTHKRQIAEYEAKRYRLRRQSTI